MYITGDIPNHTCTSLDFNENSYSGYEKVKEGIDLQKLLKKVGTVFEKIGKNCKWQQ